MRYKKLKIKGMLKSKRHDLKLSFRPSRIVQWRDRRVPGLHSETSKHSQSFTSKNAGPRFLEQKTRLYWRVLEKNEWGN